MGFMSNYFKAVRDEFEENPLGVILGATGSNTITQGKIVLRTLEYEQKETQQKKDEVAKQTCNNCPYGYKNSEFCPNSQKSCSRVQEAWRIAGLD